MRAVTTTTAAVALGIDRKTLDNAISRLGSAVVPRGRQGLERRIPANLLPIIALALDISSHLGTPIREAFPLAQRLMSGQRDIGPRLSIHADIDRIQGEISARLESAIETVVRRPRGRPPRRPRADTVGRSSVRPTTPS
jgi:hypothetical protein